MGTLPLLTAASPGSPVAWRSGEPLSAQRFLRDVHALAAALPPGEGVINLCVDRLRFATAFAAALVRGRTSLLPASTAPEALERLRKGAPGAVTVDDDVVRNCIDAGDGRSADDVAYAVPRIDSALEAAWVFTSGSTGEPVPHRKSWGSLVRCLRAGAARLGLDRGGWSVVATVPPHHLYGFELSVLMPWFAGNAVACEKPLLAPEVAAVLDSVPAPRALVTTPLHLRALLASSTPFPAVELLVSATAPLSAQLARDSEERFGAPLREIYGSTETGEMASRRTAQETLWELWPGVRLEPLEGGHAAAGGHLGESVPLQDVVEPVGPRHFLLQGRRTDLVNVAGRRSSLSYLNHQLQTVPGVLDGTFVVREHASDERGVARLAAIAVAPGLGVPALMEALRRRIDPAFLPRPLLLVDQLPRNGTGKLPHAELERLLAVHDADGRRPA